MAPSTEAKRQLASRKAFTLAELLIAMSITTLLIAGTLSAFLALSKGGMAIGNYERMGSVNRVLLEKFARDVRDADGAIFPYSERLDLETDGVTVTYEYHPDDTELTVARSDDAGSPPRVVVSSLRSFEFKAYDSDGDQAALSSEASNDVKMIQVVAQIATSVHGGADTSGAVVSARYVLRNKPIPAP